MLHPSFGRQLWSLLTLVVALTISNIGLCGEVPGVERDVELRRKVERLIGELDAQTRRARSAARESLVAMGPAILPLLPSDDRIASAAVRDAVRQVRTQLERASALATLAPSHVTLHGKWALSEVLKLVTRQTGNEFDRDGIGASVLQKEIAVDDESRPFWSACDAIAREAGLTYAPFGMRGRITLVPAATTAPRNLAVASEGAIRVAVVSVSLRPAPGDPQRRLLRIGWDVSAEPRLRPLFARISTADLVVRSSDASILKPTSPRAKLELPMGEGAQPLRLYSDYEVLPGVDLASIEFEGVFQVEMAAGPQRMVFDDLAPGKRESKRAGSARVTVESAFSPTGEIGSSRARIDVSVLYDQGGPAFESYRTWMYHNEAALETKTGRRIAPEATIATRQQGDGSISVEYNFANVRGVPGDYRFIYVVPTLITELPVKFRFPKIPAARSVVEGATR